MLRLAGRDTELLGIDREAECEAGRAAAAAGVGPRRSMRELSRTSAAWSPGSSPGASIPEADLQRETVLASVVGSLRAFHSCPPISSEFPVFRLVESYPRIASDREAVKIPGAYDDAHEVAARIEASFDAAPMTPATCHNDLLNANFLLDGDHVWIVDYEYAGMGDPFFDLGNLAVNNGLHAAGAGDAALVVLRVRERRASRTLGADARDVGLPRGDVGHGPTGSPPWMSTTSRTPTRTSRVCCGTPPTRRSTTGWARPPHRSVAPSLGVHPRHKLRASAQGLGRGSPCARSPH